MVLGWCTLCFKITPSHHMRGFCRKDRRRKKTYFRAVTFCKVRWSLYEVFFYNIYEFCSDYSNLRQTFSYFWTVTKRKWAHIWTSMQHRTVVEVHCLFFLGFWLLSLQVTSSVSSWLVMKCLRSKRQAQHQNPMKVNNLSYDQHRFSDPMRHSLLFVGYAKLDCHSL